MIDDILNILRSVATGDLLEDEISIDENGEYDVDALDSKRLARLSREVYLSDDLTERESQLIEGFIEVIKPLLVIVNVTTQSRQAVVRDFEKVSRTLAKYQAVIANFKEL